MFLSKGNHIRLIAKICLVGGLILIIALGGVALDLFLKYKEAKLSLKSFKEHITFLKQDYHKVKKQKETLEKRVIDLTNENERLKQELKVAQSRNKVLDLQIEALSRKIGKVNEEKILLAEKAGYYENEHSNMLSLIERLKEKVSILSEDAVRLQRKLLNSKTTIKELRKKLARLRFRPGVGLGSIVVHPHNSNTTSSFIGQMNTAEIGSGLRREGRILKVNKEYNFVITDLGRNDGVEVDMIMTAYHNGTRLGQIRIEKVYDTLSAGVPLFNIDEQNLRVGDIVR